ncbi:LutC/YkgG family protein [Oceanobacter mangrovi]|uniref:LutC/YkgG family protein n=1 Tax=Oceanobacter mangrovi TaxID=2862510 RepID=UPI001C8F13E9|nr:lactate utilization protein C [Oceanobacter mangrovi]
MISAKSNILGRLRKGQSVQATAASRHELPTLPRLPKDQWKASFMELMSANHADIVETTEAGWQQALVSELGSRQIGNLVVASRAENLPLIEQLPRQLSGLTVTVFDQAVEAGADTAMRSTLFQQAEAGLSYASAALAETGSLALVTGPQEPRTLSLVPPLSIVVVRESTLLSGVAELFEHSFDKQQGQLLPTNLVLVSGPSKTADIQQTLAYGAHGPKSLLILWVNDLHAESVG